MSIWVDADACPKAIKDILCRAAIKNQIKTTFVANQHIQLPSSPFLLSYQVSKGFDVADNEIVQRVCAGDFVCTQDIPLAAEILEAQPSVVVVNPRGEKYTTANIQHRLEMRNFSESMRNDYGVQGKGKATFSNQESKAFADVLNKYLNQHGL